MNIHIFLFITQQILSCQCMCATHPVLFNRLINRAQTIEWPEFHDCSGIVCAVITAPVNRTEWVVHMHWQQRICLPVNALWAEIYVYSLIIYALPSKLVKKASLSVPNNDRLLKECNENERLFARFIDEKRRIEIAKF